MMRATVYLDVLRQRRERSLQVEHVTKIYPGGVRALDDVTLSFASGLCGVIGPAGSGKSTLLRIIAMDDTPDRGAVRYDGIDGRTYPARLRAALGRVPDAPTFPAPVPIMIAMEHLAASHGWTDRRMRLAWVEAKLRQVELWSDRGMRVGELTPGMRWRFTLAMTLLASPTALLLDEPTTDLTSDEVSSLLAVLRELAEHRLVILATQDARALRELSMQVAVLHRGRVVREGTVDRLVDDLAGRLWRGWPAPAEYRAIQQRHIVLSSAVRDDRAELHVVAEESPGPDFSLIEPDLSHVFQYAMALVAR